MAKILNLPSPQSVRQTAGLRSSQNRFFPDYGTTIDDINSLILAIEQRGDWRISGYEERVKWYLTLATYPMDLLCNAATVMLLQDEPISLEKFATIATEMRRDRDAAGPLWSISKEKCMTDDEQSTTSANDAGERPMPAPSPTTLETIAEALTQISRTLQAIEFQLADRPK